MDFEYTFFNFILMSSIKTIFSALQHEQFLTSLQQSNGKGSAIKKAQSIVTGLI